jgi:hypothetical protein
MEVVCFNFVIWHVFSKVCMINVWDCSTDSLLVTVVFIRMKPKFSQKQSSKARRTLYIPVQIFTVLQTLGKISCFLIYKDLFPYSIKYIIRAHMDRVQIQIDYKIKWVSVSAFRIRIQIQIQKGPKKEREKELLCLTELMFLFIGLKASPGA